MDIENIVLSLKIVQHISVHGDESLHTEEHCIWSLEVSWSFQEWTLGTSPLDLCCMMYWRPKDIVFFFRPCVKSFLIERHIWLCSHHKLGQVSTRKTRTSWLSWALIHVEWNHDSTTGFRQNGSKLQDFGCECMYTFNKFSLGLAEMHFLCYDRTPVPRLNGAGALTHYTRAYPVFCS